MNIVLYGEEKLLLAQRLEDLKKKYQCTSDDMNYMVYHAGETPMKDIIEDALTQPFLTEYKMVVLKNPIFLTKEKPKKKLVTDEDIKLFLDYIEHDNHDYIYVMEFKLEGTAQEALKQINEKQYALPFASDPRKLFKIGINFSNRLRNIEEWIIEE